MERWSGALRLAHRSDSSPDIADAGEELKQQCSKNSVETPGMTTAGGLGPVGLWADGPNEPGPGAQWNRDPDLIGTRLNGAAAGSFQEERFKKTAAGTCDRAELKG